MGNTYDRSKGVAGWEPPIVCAKLLLAAPVCLACTPVNPGAPFTGAPYPHEAPLPSIVVLPVSEY